MELELEGRVRKTRSPRTLSVIGGCHERVLLVRQFTWIRGLVLTPFLDADFVFSPDVKYVAAISEDGCLRVIDAIAEQCVNNYQRGYPYSFLLQAGRLLRGVLWGTQLCRMVPRRPIHLGKFLAHT